MPLDILDFAYDKAMGNQIVHFEIGCRDLAASGKFYGELFDWKLEDRQGSTVIRTGHEVGGHMSALGHEPYKYTLFYVNVDDMEASIEKAKDLGGKLIVGPIEYAPGNIFAWISDPEGNTIGLHHEKINP